MKIIDIKTIPVRHYLFVEITTDNGIKGLGEAGNWGFIDATAACIKKLSEFVIDKDPFTIEHHFQNMYRAMYFRGSVIMSAISAIEIALWDIKGKALGVPVYELLGGKTRERIRTYANGGQGSAQELAKNCLQLKKQGFTAAKLFLSDEKFKEDGSDEFFSSRLSNITEKVRACREAVGNDFDFILEMHRCLTIPEAISLGKSVEQFRPYVYEDPIIPDNIDSMVQVANSISIPIATGERFTNIFEFQALLARGGASYLRPDVCAVGGINASKKIAAIAESHNVGIIPHNPLGPVSTAACVQLGACIPNLAIQELPGFMMNGQEDAMVKRPFTIQDGCIIVSSEPGIGVELSENAQKLFPPKDRAFPEAKKSFDGSVRDF